MGGRGDGGEWGEGNLGPQLHMDQAQQRLFSLKGSQRGTRQNVQFWLQGNRKRPCCREEQPICHVLSVPNSPFISPTIYFHLWPRCSKSWNVLILGLRTPRNRPCCREQNPIGRGGLGVLGIRRGVALGSCTHKRASSWLCWGFTAV